MSVWFKRCLFLSRHIKSSMNVLAPCGFLEKEGAPMSMIPPYHTIPPHERGCQYGTTPYHTIPYHTTPYHTIPYHTTPWEGAPASMNDEQWSWHSPPPIQTTDKHHLHHHYRMVTLYNWFPRTILNLRLLGSENLPTQFIVEGQTLAEEYGSDLHVKIFLPLTSISGRWGPDPLLKRCSPNDRKGHHPPNPPPPPHPHHPLFFSSFLNLSYLDRPQWSLSCLSVDDVGCVDSVWQILFHI